MNKKELVRKLIQNDSVDDWSLMHCEGRGENSSNKSDGDMKDTGHPLPVIHHMQVRLSISCFVLLDMLRTLTIITSLTVPAFSKKLTITSRMKYNETDYSNFLNY